MKILDQDEIVGVFCLLLLPRTAKNPGYYIQNKRKKTLKGEEKADQQKKLGRQGTTRQWVLWICVLPQVSWTGGWGGEAGKVETPMRTDKKNSPQKLALSLAKGPGKGNSVRQKTLASNYCCTPAKQYKKKIRPYHHLWQSRTSGE